MSADESALLDALRRGDEDAFGRLVAEHHASLRRVARLFVSVGALEESSERLKPFAMVSNLARMIELLSSRRYPSLRLDSVVFSDETHVSVIPATISRGLRRVFAKD